MPKPPTDTPKPRRKPAATMEARENRLVALATELAENQLRDGTASAQVITHYLKLGTTRERLEQEKLMQENELLKSRTDQIASAAKVEELYKEALNAMRRYSGQSVDEDPDEET